MCEAWVPRGHDNRISSGAGLYDNSMYEPLWAAASDMEIPLSLHVGTNRPGPAAFQNLETVRPGVTSNIDHWTKVSIADMIFAGVFERYPKLQIGAIEIELAWVPYFLDRIDYTYLRRPREWTPYRFKSDMAPSDFFHRNVFLSFQQDSKGIKDREIIGVDNLLWGADYPHPESTWPRSQEILAEFWWSAPRTRRPRLSVGTPPGYINSKMQARGSCVRFPQSLLRLSLRLALWRLHSGRPLSLH